MKILIEGQIYSIDALENLFDDSKFYNQKGDHGVITSVGYYHSYEKRQVIYMLPKVFMKDNQTTIFGITKDRLLELDQNESIQQNKEYKWARYLAIYFYKSLVEFRKRNSETTIVDKEALHELNSNIGEREYSYLDLVLTFVNFHKKNKDFISYKYLEFISDKSKNTKWSKTIRKTSPIFTERGKPLYVKFRNKKKTVNRQEEVIIYFYSILNHFDELHNLNIRFDTSVEILKGRRFDLFLRTGKSRLKKIKHLYFNDKLKSMLNLCLIYLNSVQKSSKKKIKEEFLTVRNYNIVFEDMVDKLFSDKIDKIGKNELTLSQLKENKDGKLIDHIYDYKSLVDDSSIFYIGDSKYYKSNTQAGELSKYKQITYAKNIIQFNIDLLNEGLKYADNIEYRNELTEGYNITPNFFIYGHIESVSNYDHHLITKSGTPIKSYHYSQRLFDRDTLFVHQYKINFLFVLKSYTTFGLNKVENFRKETRAKFRQHFLDYFNDSSKCTFEFYRCDLEPTMYTELVNDNFKDLNGKCYITNDGNLIIAKHISDSSLDKILEDFSKISQLE